MKKLILIFIGFFFFCCEESGDEVLNENQVRDIDGNIYNTIVIGKQTWMLENLNTTHYRNSDPIPNVVSSEDWGNLRTPGYSNYENDENYGEIYGKLYNWYTIDDDRNVCPEGWHIPTLEEWQELINYLGGKSVAGGKLKEVGTVHWLQPNFNSTNESGFTGLPGGYRGSLGTFAQIQTAAVWWTSTDNQLHSAYDLYITNEFENLTITESSKRVGRSIRCIKD